MNTGEIVSTEQILKTILKEECVSVEEIFQTADNEGLSLELEKLCRKRALKTAGKRHLTKKLFLNVDPNIMNDADFKEGFTKQKLKNIT